MHGHDVDEITVHLKETSTIRGRGDEKRVNGARPLVRFGTISTMYGA